MMDIKNLKIGDILVSPIFLGNIQIGRIYLNGFIIYNINKDIDDEKITNISTLNQQ